MSRPNAKKWILAFFAMSLALMLFFSVTAWVIDPFFQFRVKDNAYLLRGWFVDSGLIRNYDYDILFLGSSMVQNFDMDLAREKLGGKPLHIGMGAIRANEIRELMDIAYNAHKAEKYYICTDLYLFSGDNTESHYPEYLLRQDPLSRLRYLLSYEVWFRYIPIDAAFMLLDQMGIDLPAEYAEKKSIDKLEDWRRDFPAGTTGREAVLRNYKAQKYSVSAVDTENLYQRMKDRIDSFLNGFSFDQAEHIFFFPPYSSLFWCDTQNSGYFDTYLKARQYFVEQAELRGAAVYDFQGADCTVDLENYRDTTHYLPVVSDWMVDCFSSGDCLVSQDGFPIFQDRLKGNTERFREENPALFDQP